MLMLGSMRLLMLWQRSHELFYLVAYSTPKSVSPIQARLLWLRTACFHSASCYLDCLIIVGQS